MNGMKEFLMRKKCGSCNNVPKIILIVVVLMVLAIIFKDPITAMLQSVLGKK